VYQAQTHDAFVEARAIVHREQWLVEVIAQELAAVLDGLRGRPVIFSAELCTWCLTVMLTEAVVCSDTCS